MGTSIDWHIIIVAVVAYFIGFVSGRSAGRRGASGATVQAYAPPVSLSTALPIEQWPPYAAQEFERYMQQGKKIEAIKIYREQTGVGLKDAKDAVEAMASGRTL